MLALSAFASTARAEPTDLERARTLFDEAGELERQGQWPAAQERLRAALRIRETPHLRYALGWALENDGRLIEARTEYEVALRLAQRSGVEEVSHLAATRIGEVDHKIPLLQIHVRGSLARDTRVLVDDREVVVHGDVGTMPVDPGERHLRIERSGKDTNEQTVTMSPGVFRVVEIKGDTMTLVDDYGGAPPAKKPVLPWVLVVGGGAFVVSGIALFAWSASDASARDDATRQWCDATACVNGTHATLTETSDAAAQRRVAYDAASRGNAKQLAGGILGGVGLVAIGTGTYLMLKKSERTGRDDTPRPARTGLQVERLDASPIAGGAMACAALSF